MSPSPPSPARLRKGTLAAVVGLGAAAALLVAVPRHESGRQVEVSITADGAASLRHVSGRQYLTTYLDIAGVATVCDGITTGVRMGQRYTPAQCTAALEQELVRHAQGVLDCTPSLRLPSREQQKIAAVLLAYNIGVPAWCGSTARRRFEAGRFRAGCDAFMLWNKARVNGAMREVPGLSARRADERKRCLRGL